MTQLKETYAEIEAEAHRVAWVLMDEGQRDNFMLKVVVPRWGATTADGVVLKATAWATMVGADSEVIRARFNRLKPRSEDDSERTRSEPTLEQRGSLRSAKSALRNHPELAAELLDDPQVAGAVARAQVRKSAERAERTERKTAADPTSARIESAEAINDLGMACERFAREGNEALRKVGDLPETERFWLTGAVDRAEATARAARRYLDLGKSEIDAELAAITDGN